jgi:hypothetical protein
VIKHLPKSAFHRVPPAIAYPADYGLAGVAAALINQYGRDGAINRLIEMAERLIAGEDTHCWVLKRRRVDPTVTATTPTEGADR